jgi:YVTN family beta-propeller protein
MPERKNRKLLFVAVPLALLGIAGATAVVSPRVTRQTPVGELPESEGNAALVSSNQVITPAGKIVRLSKDRPKDVALSPDGKTLAVLAQSGVSFYSPDGELQGKVAVKSGPLGLAWTPDGTALYASAQDGKVVRLAHATGAWKRDAELTIDTVRPDGTPDVAAGTAGKGREKGDPQVAGLALSPDGKRLFVALGIRNAVAVVDTAVGKVLRSIPVGVAPYHLALSPNGKTLYVANRGGAEARTGEPSAPSAGTQVRVDPKTDAALSGSVSLVDTETLAVRATAEGIRQPSGMAVALDGKTLYVTGSDEDTVAVLAADSGQVQRRIPLRPKEDPGFGQIPTDVTVSADGKALYVSCGGANAVAVVDLKEKGRVTGWIPTGWFPIALAERGGELFVGSTKGFGSRAQNPNGSFGVHSTLGTVQFIGEEALDPEDLVRSSRLVAANNRWGMSVGDRSPRKNAKAVPVPERVGEPSVFKHVVFIIKENQTYDFILGDLPQGNGDKSLCIFGRDVTPNHHALAEEFVVLDNTYTSGTNSADGHQWTVSSVANGYMEQNYGAHARSYPYDGGDPLAYSPEGFLWTSALAKQKSVRVYGEFVNKPKIVSKVPGKRANWTELWADYKAGTKNFEITSDTDNAALKPHLHPNYIGFPTTVSDQWRADQFIADVDRFEQAGNMPNLNILLLPCDHTSGTRAGTPTPRATVADNDLALGRIVERLSKSKFWPETLILVIEDDSQFGIDHVDGHRTTALCISPYTKRGAVVSESYNHTSFLRTMGLVLGLPPMNRFDRTADPLTACFTAQPDLRPYTHLPNVIPLDEMNPAPKALSGEARRLAEACARLDWSDVDRADATTVARAVWGSVRGTQPFPWPHFHPNEEDSDEEEGE